MPSVSTDKFLSFYTELRQLSLISRAKVNRDGIVMYGEESFANRNALRLTLIQDLGLLDRFMTYSNGKQIVDHVKQFLDC